MINSSETLRRLAELAPTPKVGRPANNRDEKFDLDRWLSEHSIEIVRSSPWNGGMRHILRVCPWNSAHTNLSAFVVQHTSGAIAAGCHHNGCVGKEWPDLRELYEPGYRDRRETYASGYREQRATSEPQPHKSTEKYPGLRRGRDIVPREVEWLWNRHIPLGGITEIIGMPGQGKTTFTLDLAARVSSGRPMPDGSASGVGSAPVLILATEDQIDTVVAQRLKEADADMLNVEFQDAMFKRRGKFHQFSLLDEDDQADIEQMTIEYRIRLLVISPISAFLGAKTDSYKDSDIRIAYGPLEYLADKLNIAILVIRHPAKGSGTNPVLAGGGSIAMSAAARVSYIVGQRPDCDEYSKVLAQGKNNLARTQPSLAFRLVSPNEDIQPHIEWDGAVETTSWELMAKSNTAPQKAGRPADQFQRATEILKRVNERLVTWGGAIYMEAIKNLFKGISWDTITRARKELGIKARRLEHMEGQPWVWVFPCVTDEPLPPIPAGDTDPRTGKIVGANEETWSENN